MIGKLIDTALGLIFVLCASKETLERIKNGEDYAVDMQVPIFACPVPVRDEYTGEIDWEMRVMRVNINFDVVRKVRRGDDSGDIT